MTAALILFFLLFVGAPIAFVGWLVWLFLVGCARFGTALGRAAARPRRTRW